MRRGRFYWDLILERRGPIFLDKGLKNKIRLKNEILSPSFLIPRAPVASTGTNTHECTENPKKRNSLHQKYQENITKNGGGGKTREGGGWGGRRGPHVQKEREAENLIIFRTSAASLYFVKSIY